MEDLGANGSGNVYVFNVSSEDMTLSTNGMQTRGGTIPGWSQSGGNRYQPGGQAVPRMLNASDGPGNFFNGTNSLTIIWPDGMFTAQIRVDGSQIPLNQDLMVFIARNQWQMLNQYALQIASGTVNAGWGAEAPDAAES